MIGINILRVILAAQIVFLCLCMSCKEPELSFGEQLNQDITAIDNYLASQGITAFKDKRGIRFTIQDIGTRGLPPKIHHTVKVTYTLSRLNSQAFQPEETVQGVLSSYNDGWQLALSVMPKGTKAIVYVPSGLGFGKEGIPGVPPNSNLVYEIELEDVIKAGQEQQRLIQDIELVDGYLASQAITAEKDNSGLRYVIQETGTGAVPGWYDRVKIKYSGRILGSSNIFFSGVSEPSIDFDSRVVDFIHAFQVGLQKLPLGSKAIFYVPSGLGFGNELVGTVPANSNLMFEMELQEIIPQ